MSVGRLPRQIYPLPSGQLPRSITLADIYPPKIWYNIYPSPNIYHQGINVLPFQTNFYNYM